MDIRPPERRASELARTRPRERPLLRLACWGAGAALAAATLVVVAQSPAGGERISAAIAGLDESGRPQSRGVVNGQQDDAFVRSLEARISQLNGDRDRLAARVAALENTFQDLTGSVGQQTTKTSMTPAMAARLETVETATPAMLVAVAPPLINPLATPPAGIASILPNTSAPRETPKPLTHESASHEKTVPAGHVPLPPERLAAVAPAGAPKPAAAPARRHTEFGIELAIESSMDDLRQRWMNVKANYGPLLVGLSPVAVRDSHPGSTAVRLVAGPLPNLLAAQQLCARFAAVKGKCWPARINPADVVQ